MALRQQSYYLFVHPDLQTMRANGRFAHRLNVLNYYIVRYRE